MRDVGQFNSTTRFLLPVKVFLVVMIVSVAFTYVLLEKYASTVRIQFFGDPPGDGPAGTVPQASYDPFFIQTTFEIMQSQIVLSNVVEKLDLNVLWGKKYLSGRNLTTSESMAIIAHNLAFQVERNSPIVDIMAYSDYPNEAAAIANVVAQCYIDYRVKQRQQIATRGLEVLSEKLAEVQAKIQAATTNLNSLRTQLKITDNDPALLKPYGQETNRETPYWDSKRLLEDLKELHRTLAARIKMEELVLKTGPATLLKIVTPATPGTAPVKTNKPLCIGIGALAGIVLGGLGAFMVGQKGKTAQ